MFTRKSKKMDKNILQRAVEDEVSKIFALGQHVFQYKDAAVAKLFEDLIPSPAKTKDETLNQNKFAGKYNCIAKRIVASDMQKNNR